MTLFVLLVLVIGFLILVVPLSFVIADVLRIRADKRVERPVATSTARPTPATAPTRSSYPDESTFARGPTPAAESPVGVGGGGDPAPVPPASVTAGNSMPAAESPAGIGYLDQP
jgi:hypothetical protein